MPKRFLAFLLIAVTISAALSGCSGVGASKSSLYSEKSADSRTIIDSYQRTVTIPMEVKSAATVGSATRIVVYAGGVNKLVGITEMDKKASASRPYTVAYSSLFSTLPTTSNGNHLMETSVDGEAMLKLKPEVIISSRSKEECDDLQAKLDIPVVGVKYQNQMFSDDLMSSIYLVGDVLNTYSHAENVITKMREWQEDLNNRTSIIAQNDRPTCYAGGINYKGSKGFGGTYAEYAPFEAVNINNVADSGTKSGAMDATLEQVGVWNPSYIFLNESNRELLSKEYNENKAFFEGLVAFKTGNIYTQPTCIMNGINAELAICDAYFNGSTVYPNAFSGVDVTEKYREIIATMLGVECFEQLQLQGVVFGKFDF